jgi:hypothetical protein
MPIDDDVPFGRPLYPSIPLFGLGVAFCSRYGSLGYGGVLFNR